MPTLLFPDVRLRGTPRGVALTCDDTELAFEGCEPALLARVGSSLDGRGADVPDGSLARLVASEAVAAGLARDVAASGRVEARELFEACRRMFPRWKERVFSEDLWIGLAEGTATPSQFRGWILETFHFIQGANERLPLAVSNCPDLRVREHLAHHYTEEYDHGVFFLRSLAAVGVDEDDARGSRPLPGTRAVMNHMRRAARLDWLAYAACSGFLESTGADRERALEFFDRVAGHYGSQAIEPMVGHLRLDEEFGHGDLFESICAEIGVVSTERASAAIGAVLDLVEALELWAQDIWSVYRDTCEPPRGLYRYPGVG